MNMNRVHTSRHRTLLVWFVLLSLKPTEGVFEPNRTGNWTTKHGPRSISRPFSRTLDSGHGSGVISAHPKAKPGYKVNNSGWPRCTASLYVSSAPCGFSVATSAIPKYEWVKMDGKGVDRCMYFNAMNRMSWYDAFDVCSTHGQGRSLVRPTSQKFHDYITAHVPDRSKNYWTALNDQKKEGRFEFASRGRGVGEIKYLITNRYFAGTEPNDGAGEGSQDCIMIYKGWKWDDYNCNRHQYFICDQLADKTTLLRITHSIASAAGVIEGDEMEFSCVIDSSYVGELTQTITNRDTGRQMYVKGKINTDVIWSLGDFEAHSEFKRLQCTFRADNDNAPRCLANCKFTFRIKANAEMNGRIEHRCKGYFLERAESMEYTILPPTEFLPPIPSVLTDSERNDYKCIARVGKDKNATVSVGVFTPTPDVSDPEYIKGVIEDWKVTFLVNRSTLGDHTGHVPKGISIGRANREKAHSVGGWYINITFSIGPRVGRLHKSTIYCVIEPDRSTQSSVGPLVVKLLPGLPKMDVFWPGPRGKIYAGDVLRAKCTSLIGSLTTPSTLTWHLTLASGERKDWTIRYGGRVDTLPDWVQLRQVPAVTQCDEGEITWFPTGVCVRFVNEPYSWKSSISECRRRYSTRYDLATIDDSKYYELLKDNTGTKSYFIGLNDLAMEGSFAWWDTRSTNTSHWGGKWFNQNNTDTEWGNETLNCVSLQGRGLESVDCDARLPFICQSTQHHVSSPLNFDPDEGLSLTSYITLSVRKLQDGATLHCSSTEEAAKYQTLLDRNEIKTDSDVSDKFVFTYGQLLPKLSFVEVLKEHSLEIEVSCSAFVTPGGRMTLTLVQFYGATGRYIIGGQPDVVTKNPSYRADVNMDLDDTSVDFNRHIIASINISLTANYHLSTVTCYPYDITDETVVFTGYMNKSDLHVSHLIDLKNMSTIPLEDVIRVLGPLASRDPLDVPEGGLVYTWVLWLLLLIAVALLLTKDVGSNAKGKESGEESSRSPNYKKKPEPKPEPIPEIEPESETEPGENLDGGREIPKKAKSTHRAPVKTDSKEPDFFVFGDLV